MNQQILSQDEVDALLQGITGESQKLEHEERAEGAVRDYDLASQERIVRGRMPTMEIINERFARNIRIGLFNFIRKSPEVSIGGMKVQKYSAFLREIVVPTNFNIVSVRPLRGSGPDRLRPDARVRGDRRAVRRRRQVPRRASRGATSRPPSSASSTRLVDVIIAEYKRAWDGIYPLELDYQRSEMQPQFANIATPSEIVVATVVHARDRRRPAARSTSASRTRRSSRSATCSIRRCRATANEPDRRWVNLMKQQIQAAEVELVAELAHGAGDGRAAARRSSRATSSSSTCIRRSRPRSPACRCSIATTEPRTASTRSRSINC